MYTPDTVNENLTRTRRRNRAFKTLLSGLRFTDPEHVLVLVREAKTRRKQPVFRNSRVGVDTALNHVFSAFTAGLKCQIRAKCSRCLSLYCSYSLQQKNTDVSSQCSKRNEINRVYITLWLCVLWNPQ